MTTLTFKSDQHHAETMEKFLVYALALALAAVLCSALLQVRPILEMHEQNGHQLTPIPDDAIRCIA